MTEETIQVNNVLSEWQHHNPEKISNERQEETEDVEDVDEILLDSL